MFARLFDKTKTNITVVVKNYIHTGGIKRVYDAGNGPYIYSCLGSTPRYLMKDGTFENPEFRECNGDYITWRIHKGSESDLKFKENK